MSFNERKQKRMAEESQVIDLMKWLSKHSHENNNKWLVKRMQIICHQTKRRHEYETIRDSVEKRSNRHV